MHNSNLIINLAGHSSYSISNCTQELTPIPNGEFRKSINGNLLFLETSERHKYRSTIICKDGNAPFSNGIWIGSHVFIGCVQSLWQVVEPGHKQILLIRPAVAGSICVFNNFGDNIRFRIRDNEISLQQKYEDKVFVCFRPWLSMKVIDFVLETDEWNMKGGWKLQLEEI